MSSSDWLKLSLNSSGTSKASSISDSGAKKIYVWAVQGNTKRDARTAYLNFTATGISPNPESITVSQSGVGSKVIIDKGTTSKSSDQEKAYNERTFYIRGTSNAKGLSISIQSRVVTATSYKITSLDSTYSETHTSGESLTQDIGKSEDYYFEIAATFSSDNSGTTPRSAIITISSLDGTASDNITITQLQQYTYDTNSVSMLSDFESNEALDLAIMEGLDE